EKNDFGTDEFFDFLDAARPHVDGDVGLRSELVEEVEKFVRAEVVLLERVTPAAVHGDRALGTRSNAVAPLIFIREAAARPTNARNLERLQRLNHVAPNA